MSDIIYPTITIDINDHIKEQFNIANNSTFIDTSVTPVIITSNEIDESPIINNSTSNTLDTLVECTITQEEEV